MSIPFLIIIYKFFTHLLNLFTWIIFIIRTIRKKEEWIRRKERFGIVNIDKKSNNYIWFHAASVGELLSIQPLVKKLLNENYDILITTTTVSSAKLFKKILPNGVQHQYIPYDVPKYAKRFLNSLNIQLAIFVESEIWPNFILECKNKNIPFRTFEIKKRDEKTLGELFCFFMLETILIGRALKINPYNQPAVELIKKETKKILV